MHFVYKTKQFKMNMHESIRINFDYDTSKYRNDTAIAPDKTDFTHIYTGEVMIK